MRFADRPQRFSQPGSCVVLPGRVVDERGGVQLDTEIEGLHGTVNLWISYEGLHAIARKLPELNLIEADQQEAKLQTSLDENAALKAQVEQLQGELAEANEHLDRIAGLRRAGFTIQRKSGAPKKKAPTPPPAQES